MPRFFFYHRGCFTGKIAVSAKTLPYKNTCTGEQPKKDYPNFEEICAAKLSEKINKEEIMRAFLFLDPQKTGTCPKDRLRHAFLTLGEPLKPDELDNLLKEYTKGSTVDYRQLISALVGK